MKTAAVDIARAALALGDLRYDGKRHRWLFGVTGRRAFNNTTIKTLIDRGEAVRDGNTVREVR